jgi:hypothetical protein
MYIVADHPIKTDMSIMYRGDLDTPLIMCVTILVSIVYRDELTHPTMIAVV